MTDVAIKDAIYRLVNDGSIGSAIGGHVYKDSRPLNSIAEDVIISVIARDAGTQVQRAIANINLYVPDKRRGKEPVEDTKRIRTLASVCASSLEYVMQDGMILELASQEIMDAGEEISFHIINNRISLRFSNETA